jgi:hypothetical protein
MDCLSISTNPKGQDMIYRNFFRASVTVGALFAASAAHAQLSADAVWDSWVAYFESIDQNVEVGARSRAGDALTLLGVAFSSDFPEGGSVSMTLDQIVLTEQPDGTVFIVMPDEVPMRFVFPEMTEGDIFVVTISQPDLRTVASEVEGGVRYDYEGPELSVELTELVSEGAAMDATMNVTMADVAGFYEFYSDGIGGIDSDLTASTLAAVFKFENPEQPNEAFDMEFALTGMSIAVAADGLDLFDGENLPAALAAGFGFELATAYDAVSIALAFRDGTEDFAATASVTDVATEFSVTPERATYGTTSSNAAISISGAEIPLPSVEFGYGEFTIGASAPLSPGDDNQDVFSEVRIVDLTLSDDVWALADPASVFPRDPATVIIDIDGLVDLAGAIYDEETMMMMMMAGPLGIGELTEITLNELQINAVGAEVTGEGKFTLDYTDLETFGGIPKPVGTLSLAMKGGNGLLDTLVNMGIVPAEDAMGARMMLGLLARPVPGQDDSLTSTLEVREDGSIFANGQRIQ